MVPGFWTITLGQILVVVSMLSFLGVSLLYMRVSNDDLRDKIASMDEQLRRVQRKVFDVDV